jgi:hypothetical protein
MATNLCCASKTSLKALGHPSSTAQWPSNTISIPESFRPCNAALTSALGAIRRISSGVVTSVHFGPSSSSARISRLEIGVHSDSEMQSKLTAGTAGLPASTILVHAVASFFSIVSVRRHSLPSFSSCAMFSSATFPRSFSDRSTSGWYHLSARNTSAHGCSLISTPCAARMQCRS